MKADQQETKQPAAAETTTTATRRRGPNKPRAKTDGDILLEEARAWTKECIKLRSAFAAIASASKKGLEELRSATAKRSYELENGVDAPH